MSDEKNLTIYEELGRIVECLRNVGEPISHTRFKRWHDFDDPLLGDALEHGLGLQVLKWKTGNWYSLAKPNWNIPEHSYYGASCSALNNFFISTSRYAASEFFIENTSGKDSKIAGRWTRPDLTMVSHKTYAWTVGQEFDVTTFEIKRPNDANVLAVFEALSHSSAATRSYVVFPLKEKAWRKQQGVQADRVLDESARHGIGLLFIDKISLDAEVTERIQPIRQPIDHEKCGNFLDAVLSDVGQKRIASWKR